jgi:hypothetical protein
MHFNYRQMASGTTTLFDNDFFQAKFKRLSGTFSTERLGPCIRAGFFCLVHYAPPPGGALTAHDKSQFITDMRQRNII